MSLRLTIETDKLYDFGKVVSAQMGANSLDRDASSAFDGEFVGTAADCGKCDCPSFSPNGKSKCRPIAGLEHCVLIVVTPSPDRPNCVNHVPGFEIEPLCYSGGPRRAPSKAQTCFQKFRSSPSVNRPVHAAAPTHRRVRRVDNDVNIRVHYVATDDNNAWLLVGFFAHRSSDTRCTPLYHS